ncbi:MAG: DoxX family membrane protein [Paludibacteraceae bacterium]|nr:DoxX family membrane protein [Paludibacteraceae bacterium]
MKRNKKNMDSRFGNRASIIAGISRTLLGLVFIFSGAVKAIDPLGTVYKIEDYLKAFGGFFTELLPMAEVAAWGLIILELLLGVCMVLNVRTQWTSWISLIFYLVMTPLTLYIALTNPVSDCGCFGDAVVLTNWQTFSKNVVLITLAIILVALRKRTRQLWSNWMEVVLATLTIIAAIAFMTWTRLHLPVKDFRPYKIGNHLPTLMEYPEDTEPDVYEYSFVYEKDGVEQTFTLDNYPKGDSTWTFVRSNSKLIKKGYEPPIHDFEIINAEGEDLTWDILESEEPITLVVMYDLAKADKKQMAKVEALLGDEAMRQEGDEAGVYILTGSGTDEIINFSLKYPALSDCICTCDPVTLKTIVRANPGAIVVQNGTVIDKYNLRDRD